MSKLSLEQVKQRLIPVLKQVSTVFTLDSIGKERKRWDYVHKELGSLLLDIEATNEEEQGRCMHYTDPCNYIEDTDSGYAELNRRVIERMQRRHGKNLRGGATWLIWGAVLLIWPFYIKLAALSLPDWPIWLCAGFGWVFVVFGAMIVCNEWRKE